MQCVYGQDTYGRNVFHPLRSLFGRHCRDDGGRSEPAAGLHRRRIDDGFIGKRVQKVRGEQRGQIRRVHLVAGLNRACIM